MKLYIILTFILSKVVHIQEIFWCHLLGILICVVRLLLLDLQHKSESCLEINFPNRKCLAVSELQWFLTHVLENVSRHRIVAVVMPIIPTEFHCFQSMHFL